MEEEILKMYFEDKLKQIEISNKLNISKYKVSSVLNKNENYLKEKEYRKEINRQKHIEDTKKYIISKRNELDMEYLYLKQLHLQATSELSERRTISNKAFRDWNSSAYKYNSKKQCYDLDKKINAGYDVPKRIYWKNI